MNRFLRATVWLVPLALALASCAGDDSPWNRTCYVPGVSYAGPERGLVYLLFLRANGEELYRAVGGFNYLDDRSETLAVTHCFDIPFYDIARVRAWMGVGDETPSGRCFGAESTPTSCAPRPGDPAGEISVSLKPRQANRIVVPLR